MVLLSLLSNFSGDLLDLLLTLDLLALLLEEATLIRAREIRFKFLLEQEELLLFHPLLGTLRLAVEVEILSLPSSRQRSPTGIRSHGSQTWPLERRGDTSGCYCVLRRRF